MATASSEQLKNLKGKFGSVEIIEQIGVGGMGAVYKAHRSSDGKLFALKILQLADTPEGHVVRFRREARIGALLQHDNIVNVYESGEKDGYLFMVMTYVDGSDLGEYLAQHKPLTWKQVARFGTYLAASLDHCHARNVIHRDVKPANAFLSSDGKLYLGDFGLALIQGEGPHKEEDQQAGIQMIVGTPSYMPPEQFRRPNGVDARSDLYSLGCLLYELLTDTRPFRGSNLEELQNEHERKRPTPIKKFREDVPKLLKKLIQRLMAKRADWRYESAATVEKDLEGILSGTLTELSKDTISTDSSANIAATDSSDAIVTVTSVSGESGRQAIQSASSPIMLYAAIGAVILLLTIGSAAFLMGGTDPQAQYNDHMKKGRTALESKDWKQALHHFTQAGYVGQTSDEKRAAEELYRKALGEQERNQ